MNEIKVMDENLSNKIAAGEVVETLMNVVKELVENSIDAGSTEIKVELIESGIREIRVIDNGKGMNRVDALKSIERHATSKIYTDYDLFNINTLGFRGEALPSIASVSKMIIKTSDGKEGTTITIHGGKVIDNSLSDLRKGTETIVSDIFYNTPARLKYLKSLYTELANTTNYMNKMALAYPHIKFILINDHKTILNTDGSSNDLKVINSIYGLDVTKKMVKIMASDSDYSIDGYISYPEINRSNRNFITILVNNRYIRNNDLNNAIIEAYHTYLPIGRYPIVVLNIDCDPSIIDINIHPTKRDIKFSKLEEIKTLVLETIKEDLEKLILIPEIKAMDSPISNIMDVKTINSKVSFEKDVIKPSFESISFDFKVSDVNVPYEKSKEKFKMIEPLALVHGTYIVGENEDGMFILDQHAVNERINYEYYKNELGKERSNITDLLIPIKMEFVSDEYLRLKENLNLLKDLNINYEEFGNNTIIIRSHPTWIKIDYVEESLRKIMEVIVAKEAFDKEKFNERVAITLACKMSIKANEHISLEEMKTLILRLRDTLNPFTCPHGRPTIISYSKYELEKLFKRVM